MKVFFLVFLVILYIHVIFNFDIDEKSTGATTTNKYDKFKNDNRIKDKRYKIKDTDNYTQEDISASATAIVEVINEFFVKQNLQFDFVIIGEPKQKFYSLINEIGKRNFHNYSTTIIQHDCSKGNIKLRQSAVIFIRDEDYEKTSNYLKARNKFLKKLKFLIYTNLNHNLSLASREESHKKNSKKKKKFEPIVSVNYIRILPFQYFLVDTKDKLELTTFEWFTETECNFITYKIINRFSKTSLKWENQLENHEKFKNLHNCMIAVRTADGSEYFNFYDGKWESFIFNMMDILAKKLNFIQQTLDNRNRFSVDNNIETNIIEFNYDVMPGVDFLSQYKYYHFTTTFTEDSILFMITPGEEFTSYEKILMPFDELTWYFIVATFAVAFGVIFVVSFLPQKMQDYFYGDGVKIPAYNVIGTFFGIGQMKLPVANFSRMVLMIFILFCLIIRTAYQGVMFDMMTSEMRKSSPQTVDDLFEWNFNVNLLTTHSEFVTISKRFYDGIDKSLIPSIHRYEMNDFYGEICSIIFDPKLKFAVNVDRYLYKAIKNLCGKSPKLLVQVYMTIPMGIAVNFNNFLLEGMEDVMQHTIPAGIPQYWHKYHQWYEYERNHYGDVVETGATVLRLEDLSFGFIIWMISCGVAVLGLFGELLTFAISKMKKMTKVEPKEIKSKVKVKVKIKKTAKLKRKNIQIPQQQQQSTLDVQVLMKIQEEMANETETETATTTATERIQDENPENLVADESQINPELAHFEIEDMKQGRKCSTAPAKLNDQNKSIETKVLRLRPSTSELN